MNQKPVLVVLAAGMGSRYGGLKQMDPVGNFGQSIIDYSIYDARRAGFEKVVFIIKHEIEEDFKTLVGSRIGKGMEIAYAYQELNDLPDGYSVPENRKKPWGTTHAVLAARDVIDGPFVVINADDYYGRDAFQKMFDYLSRTEDCSDCYRYAMIGYLLGNTVTDNGSVARGVCEVKDGKLSEIVERTCIEKNGDMARFSTDGGKTWENLSYDTLVSMNFWGFQRSFIDEAVRRLPEFLDDIFETNPEKGEFFLPLLVSQMIHEQAAQVEVLSSTDKWFGVTYREDKPSVVAAIRQMTEDGLYPDNLWDI